MAELHGLRAHLRVVNKRNEVLVDGDVNRVVIDTQVRWETWDITVPGAKATADLHEVSMRDLIEVTVTPCSDRLKRAEVDAE